ncbi:phosphotransferase [Gemmobacter sp. 24YEA27]|uniref:phosphotransferase n=1 Tax=Gemmobacter sp. 24YEA27 TaxID=3040672 RepID=UPI0024B325B0|nr:phosphotransferase [Gemmobacter sp. 24YEA27]
MSQIVTDADVARVIAAAPGLDGAQTRPGPAALASPSCRGLESAAVFVDLPDGESRFLKIIHPEIRDVLDLPTGFAAAKTAGEAGVAPRVLWSDPEAGAILFAAAGPGWREARLADCLDADFRRNTMQALRRLHETPANGARFEPFARLEALISEAGRLGDSLPADLVWIMSLLNAARPVLEAAPLALCRNESSVSNLMIGPDQAAMLVDFDRAGLNDPMYDLGAVLAEMHEFERDMQATFRGYGGDEAGFARARLWSVVDDMIQAIFCRIFGHVSVRKSLEWLKFGEWRLMRARLALHHPGFEEKIRIAEGRA